MTKKVNGSSRIIYEDEDAEEEKIGRSNNSKIEKTIGLYCFDASLAFKSLINEMPRSLILTSGTLTPMDSLEEEIGLIFREKHSLNHIIKKS